VGAALAALVAYVATNLAYPEVWNFVPSTRRWDTFLASSTMLLLGFSALRYWQAWRLTRFPGQAAMVCALLLLAESQVSMYYGQPWHLSWWLYHLLMLAAFGVLLGGWAFEAVRARSLVLFSLALSLRDELDHVNLSQPETLAALEEAMAGKDAFTRDHMGRVAVYAPAIARELGCNAATVAIVEAAGRIHDIGKIAVPDTVLMKPGRLTDREFEQMKHHTDRGAHIALVSGSLAPLAGIIRGHHERWDGRGYPDHLEGHAIPLAARILAVADTFDAMVSARVYRGARPRHEAIAELRRVSGTQLDPECVEALLRTLRAEDEAALGRAA
jgi:HD-GYP domain-containing protein (c-di-GMP phosphodiesterase class II)